MPVLRIQGVTHYWELVSLKKYQVNYHGKNLCYYKPPPPQFWKNL